MNLCVMDFVELRSFDNYIFAHITLSMLQDAGINCHLKDEYIITLDPFLSPAMGGMKLMVYPSQAQRAIELLEETER
jgi:Putative prokaryotic signal transducing protein